MAEIPTRAQLRIDATGSSVQHWPELDAFNRASFEADVRQLEAFRRSDFASAMSGELAKVFEDYDKIQLRYLALVSYYCEVKARQYVRAPLRDMDAGSQAQVSKLQDLYKRSRLDARLLEAQQRSWGSNSVVLSIQPGFRPNQLDAASWLPADVIVYGDPTIDDIRDAERVEVRVPVKRRPDSTVTLVWYGKRVYTRDEAYVEFPGGKRRGIFNEAGTNPLGYPPCVAVRLTTPDSGLFFPPAPKDLLSVQIGTIIAVSDMELIARMKVSPREVVTGPGAQKSVAKVDAGPNALIGLQGGELDYTAVNLDPRIDRYIEAIEYMQAQWSHFRHIEREWIGASSGITGAAKEVERASILEDQYRSEQIWREAERDLIEVVADVSRFSQSALAIQSPEVRVDYRYFESRQNDLQEAQSLALLSALGLRRATQWIAEHDGVTLEEAAERLSDNLEERKQIMESWRPPADAEPPPGLDAIAAQVMG